MKFVRPRRDPVEVNLTPLIDVVFLLLIFFMVSTTFETRQALELALPESQAGTPVEQGPVTLSVDASGIYRLGEQSLASVQALHDALASQVDAAREHGLVIEADATTAHADVVAALDQAALLGIQRVRIATRQGAQIHERTESP
jgi:biopolymer transport protein ExbD